MTTWSAASKSVVRTSSSRTTPKDRGSSDVLPRPRRSGSRRQNLRGGSALHPSAGREHGPGDGRVRVDAISNIERGKGLPSLETLEAIATQLEIPITEFFDKPKGRLRQTARRVELLARFVELARGLPDRSLEIAVKQVEALADKVG